MVFLTSGRGPDGGGGGQFETSKFSFEDPSLDPSIFSFICEKVFFFFFFPRLPLRASVIITISYFLKL